MLISVRFKLWRHIFSVCSRVRAIRYADRAWLRQTRRWPPRLCAALEAFLDIRAVNKDAAAPAVT